MTDTFHETTRKQLDIAAQHKAQSYIFSGTASGKKRAAHELAQKWSAHQTPSILRVSIEHSKTKSIGIEQFQELLHKLQLKYAGSHRLVLLEEADLLTREAQNTLLKTIEDAPMFTTFVFCVDHELALLPTIRSRSHVVRFAPLQKDQVALLVEQSFSGKDYKQLLHSTDGAFDSIAALLEDKELLQAHRANVSAAKALLSPNLETRMKAGLSMSDKSASVEVIRIVARIIRYSIKNSNADTAAFEQKLNVCLKALQLHKYNVQPKLINDFLALSL